jgi:D-glycero-D-manno-heptose 1,7-bisphosphate phosphatase
MPEPATTLAPEQAPIARWQLGTAFLDRDGTINRKAPDGDYVKSVRELELLPGAADAVAALSAAGLRVIVVTNQRGIARGLMSEDDLREIHAHMLRELARAGARVDAVYHCPHAEGECACRKPAVGLFERARRDFPDIDFARSVVIGDSARDMDAGRALSARLVRIGSGGRVDIAASSLADAVAALTAPR